jgi:hypothetical protein
VIKCAGNMVETLQLHGDVLTKDDLIRREQQKKESRGNWKYS